MAGRPLAPPGGLKLSGAHELGGPVGGGGSGRGGRGADGAVVCKGVEMGDKVEWGVERGVEGLEAGGAGVEVWRGLERGGEARGLL